MRPTARIGPRNVTFCCMFLHAPTPQLRPPPEDRRGEGRGRDPGPIPGVRRMPRPQFPPSLPSFLGPALDELALEVLLPLAFTSFVVGPDRLGDAGERLEPRPLLVRPREPGGGRRPGRVPLWVRKVSVEKRPLTVGHARAPRVAPPRSPARIRDDRPPARIRLPIISNGRPGPTTVSSPRGRLAEPLLFRISHQRPVDHVRDFEPVVIGEPAYPIPPLARAPD